MNPALFNRRISIQQQTEIINENGFKVKSSEEWQEFKSAWAMIKTPNDKTSNAEFYQAATTYARSTLTFVIRYTKGINSDMRIKYGDRYFEIAAPPIDDNERHKTLTIIGREVM
jgi:SPP1 family predicted phage head-tail adaptor